MLVFNREGLRRLASELDGVILALNDAYSEIPGSAMPAGEGATDIEKAEAAADAKDALDVAAKIESVVETLKAVSKAIIDASLIGADPEAEKQKHLVDDVTRLDNAGRLLRNAVGGDKAVKAKIDAALAAVDDARNESASALAASCEKQAAAAAEKEAEKERQRAQMEAKKLVNPETPEALEKPAKIDAFVDSDMSDDDNPLFDDEGDEDGESGTEEPMF